MTFRHAPAAVLLLLTLALAPGTLRAQVGQQPPSGMTEVEVLDQLRQSGLTRDAARARLVQLGRDPGLADPYFDRLEGRSAQPIQAGNDVFAGVLRDLVPAAPPVTVAAPSEPKVDSKVFGRAIFAGSTTEFQPVTNGPVDAGYRLGPGDQLTLVLTGGVELAYTLDVTREGFVVIPDVGQVFVSGLTLESLRNQLYERLGRVYSGVRRSGATTFFDVSLGRLRTNQVFVIGDVVRPGAYQVSSVSTVFNALHLGGGPSDLGSFRRVQVRRGGALVAEVDLYDYLISGDASRDVRLDQGDVVFIPAAGPQVSIKGKVRRPAIYEMKDGETLENALAFAGGFEADAHVQRIQIDRILPPAERRPGMDRVVIDVDVTQAGSPLGSGTVLRDGDDVTVFATLAERRNRVTLDGSVFRPGEYEYTPGLTVWDLIQRADGLAPDAYRPVAHVVREVIPGPSVMLRVSLEPGANGRPLQDLPLADGDQVVIYSSEALGTSGTVRVEGWVKKPGEFPFRSGATVEDLVLAAGGFEEGAEPTEVEVSRLRVGRDRSDTISANYAVALGGEIPAPWLPEGARPSTPGATPSADFHVQGGDRVFVRQLPGYVKQRTVTIRGEVLHPGPYSVQLRDERISSAIARAGVVTRDAYVKGARLTRGGLPVAINLERAIKNRGSRDDIAIEEGDVLDVPRIDPTVTVTGAVAFPSRVVYRSGTSLAGYLAQAGGATEIGDVGRASVTYANGERATVHKTLFFSNSPSIEPGSTIFVPSTTPKEGVNWDELLTRTLSITASLVTVLLAASKL